MQALRRLGLAGTEMAEAQCDTIRLKLFKIGARIRITVRKVWVAYAGGYPYKGLFSQIVMNLMKIPSRYDLEGNQLRDQQDKCVRWM